MMPYLQMCLPTKAACAPEISINGAFMVVRRQAQSGENRVAQCTYSQVKLKGSVLLSCCGSRTVYKCTFHGLFSGTFLLFCVTTGDFAV